MIRITLIAAAALVTIATASSAVAQAGAPVRTLEPVRPRQLARPFDRGAEGRALCRQELRRQADQARVMSAPRRWAGKTPEFTLPQCGKRSKTI